MKRFQIKFCTHKGHQTNFECENRADTQHILCELRTNIEDEKKTVKLEELCENK